MSRRFYEVLGLSFIEEKHGSGPAHFSCDVDGVVLELYPLRANSPRSAVRLGFTVDDLEATNRKFAQLGTKTGVRGGRAPACAVVVDPDGNAVEVEQAVRLDLSEYWCVWRQDDNGNRFLVESKLDKSSAELRVSELTALGHKQMYWVAEMLPRGTS